jgi:hypothetical protein
MFYSGASPHPCCWWWCWLVCIWKVVAGWSESESILLLSDFSESTCVIFSSFKICIGFTLWRSQTSHSQTLINQKAAEKIQTQVNQQQLSRCRPTSIAISSRCGATLRYKTYERSRQTVHRLPERSLLEMPHTDGGIMSSRREFHHRPRPSNLDNRVFHWSLSLHTISKFSHSIPFSVTVNLSSFGHIISSILALSFSAISNILLANFLVFIVCIYPQHYKDLFSNMSVTLSIPMFYTVSFLPLSNLNS